MVWLGGARHLFFNERKFGNGGLVRKINEEFRSFRENKKTLVFLNMNKKLKQTILIR